MASTLTANRVPVKRGMTPKLVQLRAKLRRHGVTWWQIAQAAEVSEPYVFMALTGRRRGARVIKTAERLLAERQAKPAESQG